MKSKSVSRIIASIKDIEKLKRYGLVTTLITKNVRMTMRSWSCKILEKKVIIKWKSTRMHTETSRKVLFYFQTTNIT